ncbi:hypothetical protein B296_00025329, partial [Ensete ventricosum]
LLLLLLLLLPSADLRLDELDPERVPLLRHLLQRPGEIEIADSETGKGLLRGRESGSELAVGIPKGFELGPEGGIRARGALDRGRVGALLLHGVGCIGSASLGWKDSNGGFGVRKLQLPVNRGRKDTREETVGCSATETWTGRTGPSWSAWNRGDMVRNCYKSSP